MRFAVLAAVASFAVATPALAEDFQGPYVGAGVTLDTITSSGDYEFASFSGVGGTLFGGYDFKLDSNTFASLEANIDLATADVDSDNAPVSIEAKNRYGVSARLGYKLNNDTAIYGRLGYSHANASIGMYGDEGDVDLDGIRYGVGIQSGLTEKLSVRAEFSQTAYELKMYEYGPISQNIDINNNQVQVALSYGF